MGKGLGNFVRGKSRSQVLLENEMRAQSAKNYKECSDGAQTPARVVAV